MMTMLQALALLPFLLPKAHALRSSQPTQKTPTIESDSDDPQIEDQQRYLSTAEPTFMGTPEPGWCGCGFYDGKINDGNCYATTGNTCVEHTFAWSTIVNSGFVFYNALYNEKTYDTSALVIYAHASVNVEFDSRSESGGSCSVAVDDIECNCTSDGYDVTVTSCDGLPADGVQFDGFPQTVDAAWGSFKFSFPDNIQEMMCEHPSVIAQRAPPTGAPTATTSAPSTTTGPTTVAPSGAPNVPPGLRGGETAIAVVAVPTEIKLWFQHDETMWDAHSEVVLLEKIVELFSMRLMHDSGLRGSTSVDLESIHADSSAVPVTISFTTKIATRGELPEPSDQHLIDTLAGANWSDFIHQWTRDHSHQAPDALQNIRKILYKGIGRKGHVHGGAEEEHRQLEAAHLLPTP